jgi:hypothetical protein
LPLRPLIAKRIARTVLPKVQGVAPVCLRNVNFMEGARICPPQTQISSGIRHSKFYPQ